MTQLSDQQTLSVYVSFQTKHSRPPTLAEVAEEMDVSPQAISIRAQRLLKEGWLELVNAPKPAPRGRYRASKRAMRSKP